MFDCSKFFEVQVNFLSSAEMSKCSGGSKDKLSIFSSPCLPGSLIRTTSRSVEDSTAEKDTPSDDQINTDLPGGSKSFESEEVAFHENLEMDTST